MYIDLRALELAEANACMSKSEVIKQANISKANYMRACNGANVTPKTVGLIAKALGVKAESIIDNFKNIV